MIPDAMNFSVLRKDVFFTNSWGWLYSLSFGSRICSTANANSEEILNVAFLTDSRIGAIERAASERAVAAKLHVSNPARLMPREC